MTICISVKVSEGLVLASGSLSSYLIPHYDEAMGYLQKAVELSPEDGRINEIRTVIRDTQFTAYTAQAIHLNQESLGVKKLGSTGRDYAVKYTIESMEYLIMAHKIKPGDAKNLENLCAIKENGLKLHIRWDEEVFDILTKERQRQARREDQQAAANRLVMLRERLKQREAELGKLDQKKKGFFVNMEIEDVQAEIKNIAREISKLESAINP